MKICITTSEMSQLQYQFGEGKLKARSFVVDIPNASLTQEQIDTMVHDSCVLFCKHYGCGIPRDTCISLGTCQAHDEYRKAIRAYLMKD